MNNPSTTGQVVDARERRVSQLDPFELWLRRRHDSIPPDVLNVLAREIGLGLAKGQRVLFYVSLLCLAIVLTGMIERSISMLLSGGFTYRALASVAMRLLPVCVGPLIFWAGARRLRLARTTQAMLRHRRCPHCGYDLHGLPTDPSDSATVCPECGCAWRLPEQAAA